MQPHNRFRKSLLFLLLFVVSILPALSASYTWTGSSSTNWNTASNWSPAGVPTSTDNVTIATASNAPALSGNVTVTNFTLQSGSIQLNGYTLNITGVAYFPAGTVGAGAINATGSATTFGGSSTGPVINASVNIVSGSIIFQYTTFNTTASFEKTGASGDTGNGGNVFNGVTTIKFSSATGGYITSAQTTSDTFNGDLTLINTGTSGNGIYLARAGTANAFNGNISVSSTANSNILFGDTGGKSTLLAGKTISIGSQGFSAGGLSLAGITQNGTAAVNLPLTGTSTLTLGPLTNFGGPLTATAGGILLNGVTCNGTTYLEKTGSSGENGNGGNVFNGATTIKYSATGSGGMGSALTSKDVFNGDLTIISNSNSGYGLYLSRATTGNEYNGNIIINSTGSALISFGYGNGTSTLATGKTISIGSQGYSAGTLQLAGITQNGTAAVNLSMTGTSILTLGPLTNFGGPLTATAGGILLNGVTCNGTTYLEKTGSSGENGNGGNVFNGATTIKYSATGSGGMGSALTSKDVFNGDLTIISNSNSGYGLYLSRATTGNEYNGNIIINSTGSALISFGYGNGTSTLATGKTISIGSQGYSAGTLQLAGITQNGTAAVNLPLTGTSTLTLGPLTNFGGPLTATALGFQLNGVTCNNTAYLEKTGTGGYNGQGGNTFSGPTTFKIAATGGGYWTFGESKKDVFGNNLTLTTEGPGQFYLSRVGTGHEFNGDIIINSSNANGSVLFGDQGGLSTLKTGHVIRVESANFTAGRLSLAGITQEGADPMTLSTSGSSVIILGPATTFRGDLTVTAGGIQLDGVTCEKTATLTKTGTSGENSRGGNWFKGVTSLTFASPTGTYWTTGNTVKDIFGSTLTVTNSGTAGGGLYLSRGAAGSEYQGDIIVNSTNAGGFIYFGESGGTSILSSGRKIAVGSLNFTAGSLRLWNFTQLGAAEQSLTFGGNAELYLNKGNVFNGIVRFTAPNLYLDQSTFLNEAYFTKTGNTTNSCSGGNTFTKKVLIACTGTGSLNMATAKDDVVMKPQ
ncbi:hypothetical protein [Xanthocytophaga agilis]|uniref:Autotransporter domain-containing protein n=1 Tax=Xanthocytophaga agilis TaxID=3048010 RepID=A0AAE3R005_9BACT|nr:hypothetical protein [Xanthocytophaga agilis]MDJ1501171.1 hypothetical protein [Xanthocytophaga agilis]